MIQRTKPFTVTSKRTRIYKLVCTLKQKKKSVYHPVLCFSTSSFRIPFTNGFPSKNSYSLYFPFFNRPPLYTSYSNFESSPRVRSSAQVLQVHHLDYDNCKRGAVRFDVVRDENERECIATAIGSYI